MGDDGRLVEKLDGEDEEVVGEDEGVKMLRLGMAPEETFRTSEGEEGLMCSF